MSLTFDSDAIREAVIARVADEVMSEYDYRADIRAEANKRIGAIFKDAVAEEVKAAVVEAVQSGFDREYQKVDTFGGPKGPATTIRKELENLIANYWSARVNASNGQPTDSSYSSVSRAEWMMVQICGEKFKDDMKSAMVSATAHLKDGLRAELRKQTDQMLGDLFHVRSAQDQAEGRYK